MSTFDKKQGDGVQSVKGKTIIERSRGQVHENAAELIIAVPVVQQQGAYALQ